MLKDSTDVFKEMEALLLKHMELRAHFPYTNNEMIGQRTLETAPIYTNTLNKYIIFDFGENGLSAEDVQRINEIGGFLNENFIIRLCALLEGA